MWPEKHYCTLNLSSNKETSLIRSVMAFVNASCGLESEVV